MIIDDYPELESIKDAIHVLPVDKQDSFVLEYLKRRKNHWTTFILCLCFGLLSFHRFYLGIKKPIGYILLFHAFGLMFLQFFFTGDLFNIFLLLLLAIEIIAVYDLFTFKKFTREANIRIACEIIKGITDLEKILK